MVSSFLLLFPSRNQADFRIHRGILHDGGRVVKRFLVV